MDADQELDAMSRRIAAEVYADPAMAARYATHTEIHPAEQILFDQFLGGVGKLLDLGVGAGRTAGFLSGRAKQYIGIDLSEEMIEACQSRHPSLDFRKMNATNLNAFGDGSLDAVVFSFNGLDCIPDQAGRRACLLEVARVLRPGGPFVFSSHNPRYLVFRPTLRGLSISHATRRLGYATLHTMRASISRPFQAAFWRGYGGVWDPNTEGGMAIQVATPGRVRHELGTVGFHIARVINGDYPRSPSSLATPWYYYAAIRD